MKKLSKILIPIFVIAIALSALLVFASADGGNAAEIGDKQYATFEEAISDAHKQENATVKLLRNVTATETVKINASMTLDLNGFSLSYKSSDAETGSYSFETFITVRASYVGEDVAFNIVGDGMLNVEDARLFRLQSNETAKASLSVKGRSGRSGLFINHTGFYSTLYAEDHSTVALENLSLLVKGNCLDNSGYVNAPANLQLDGSNVSLTMKNCYTSLTDTSAGLLRIAGSKTSALIENCELTGEAGIVKLDGALNESDYNFVILDVKSSSLKTSHKNSGLDVVFNAGEAAMTGVINIDDSLLLGSQAFISGSDFEGSGHELVVNMTDSDFQASASNKSPAFSSGQARINAKNCGITCDGGLGTADSDYYSFVDCYFSAKLADNETSLSGGEWVLTFEKLAFPWKYMPKKTNMTFTKDGVAYYFAGDLECVADKASAVALYTEGSANATRIFFYDADDVKTYLRLYENGNGGIDFELTAARPGETFSYDDAIGSYVFVTSEGVKLFVANTGDGTGIDVYDASVLEENAADYNVATLAAAEIKDNYKYILTANFNSAQFLTNGARTEMIDGTETTLEKDNLPGGNGISENTIKVGRVESASSQDGTKYFKFTAVDPAAGTSKASTNGKIKYKDYTSDSDTYYVMGPGFVDFQNSNLPLKPYGFLVFDLDVKGSAQGFAATTLAVYTRYDDPNTSYTDQLNATRFRVREDVFMLTSSKDLAGNALPEQTMKVNTNEWHHVQIRFNVDTGVITYFVNGEEFGYDYLSTATIEAFRSSFACCGIRYLLNNDYSMNIGSELCVDNFVLRGYESEETAVYTAAPSTPIKPEPTPDYLVRIGDKHFTTLAAAIEAAKDGDVIELNTDTSKEQIQLEKSITLVTNGFGYPSFTYIDPVTGSYYVYTTEEKADAATKVLIIDASEAKYLYPSGETDFSVILAGETIDAGVGEEALASAIAGAKNGAVIHVKKDFALTQPIGTSSNKFAIDLEGHTLTIAEGNAALLKIGGSSNVTVFSSKPGAMLNSENATNFFEFSGTGATFSIGRYTDPNTDVSYDGDNVTVVSKALTYVSQQKTKFVANGGSFICTGLGEDSVAYAFSKCNKNGANAPTFTFNNANIFLTEETAATQIFGVETFGRTASQRYYINAELNGCSVFGSTTNAGVGLHSVTNYLGYNSVVSVANTYLYNTSVLGAAVTSASTQSVPTIERGTFSNLALTVLADGTVPEKVDVQLAEGCTAQTPAIAVAMAFAGSKTSVTLPNGDTLDATSYTAPMAYFCGDATDLFVNYRFGDFTSRIYVKAADADLSSFSTVPSAVSYQLPRSVSGLYSWSWQMVGTEAANGVTTVTLDTVLANAFSPLSSVSLGESLNYLVYIPRNVINSGLVTSLVMNGEEVDLKNATYVTLDGTSYLLLTREVTPVNASGKFDLVIKHGYFDKAGENTQAVTLSIADYAEDLLADTAVTKQTKQLLVDVLYYLLSARAYLGEEIDESDELYEIIVASKLTPTATTNLSSALNSAAKPINSITVKEALAGVSVNLNGDSASLIFRFQEGFSGNITFTYTGLDGKTVSVTANAREVDSLELELPAALLSSDIVITTDSAETAGNVYNLASYVLFAETTYADTEPMLVNLVKALYGYSVSAKAA